MASTLFSAPTFGGLRPLNKPTDTCLFLNKKINSYKPMKKRCNLGVKAELNTSLVIRLSTGLSLFLGRFVFFNFQRENVAKQGLVEQNGVSHFEPSDSRAKEYVSLLKYNYPVGFNIVDVLAWGSIGHIIAYYVLATSSNGMILSSLVEREKNLLVDLYSSIDMALFVMQ
ncbi:photosystem I reaction center subunit V, chloroplastic-like [Nicotiana tabacum]|uniref:Photosystem I reaction center subunit V, chloroplastic n=1 Tax=Nicotiana tabacum TaxID=4097 RepID=A0A1S4D6K5_TOBAC|nr:PREDICTED: photosystem I reaction center subunit V, chloroplastic-like [Nicotiana tabacum]